MTRMEQTRALRASVEPHYNCCQSVLVPFAKEMGMTEERAYALGAHFAAGMGHGAACGTITSALMVLGMAGYSPKEANALLRQFLDRHGSTECRVLLKAAHDRGEEKKPHCDGLVYEMVETLEKIFQAKGE